MIEENTIYQEPCLETVTKMPDNFIDCVITSPPYWQLRDYGYDGQWGLEPTYQQYLENLWSLMDAIYPKLKDGGTVWVNLGDSYYGSGHGQNSRFDKGEITHLDKYYGEGRNASPVTDWDYSQMKPKTLMLIPHRFAIGCIDRGWIMRNDIIWAKRNGMPESVTDRFSKKHEYFFFMVKNEKYHFDLDAIRDKVITASDSNDRQSRWSANYDGLNHGRNNDTTTKIPKEQSEMFGSPRARQHREGDKNNADGSNPKGKNPGSVSDFWDIPTKPSSRKHYASYNDSLLVKPILGGCPKGGIIYDPFMGTGSTAEAAIRAGRKFIGSEMSEEYVRIAEERLDPFLRQKTLF